MTPATITARRISAEVTEPPIPVTDAVKNMVIREIREGNLPLQGTKLFVSIAISLSLGESIMRQPVTPAALQPSPMHMDRIKPLVIVAYGLLP